MLARATRRKLRRDAFTTPLSSHQLTLPWLCPALSRVASTTKSPKPSSRDHSSTRRPTIAVTPRRHSRHLATAAEFPSTTPSIPYHLSAQSLMTQLEHSSTSELKPWDGSSPLILPRLLDNVPATRAQHGMGSDPVELHQSLYACLRVGRLDRAAIILDRIRPLYIPTAPEIVDAHSVYLQAFYEQMQQDPQDDSMQQIEQWYNANMVCHAIPPNAHTFVILIRAAMAFLEGAEQDNAVREQLAFAHEFGPEMVEEINGSPEFSDEEWETLIRLQPDAFDEPPALDEVQELQYNTPSAREQLAVHGFLSLDEIKPQPQEGMGLESLKAALTPLHAVDAIPYPHNMAGTQEEKDKAYALARQVHIEENAMAIAVQRWKYEAEKLDKMGIHVAIKSRSIQALMYTWYTALVPQFKKSIQHVKAVLSAPIKENLRDDAHGYGLWLEKCKPEDLAAITIDRVINACVGSKRREDQGKMKISSITNGIGGDIEKYLRNNAKARREAFLKRQRKETRQGLVGKLSKTSTSPSPATKEMDPPAFLERDSMPPVIRTKLGAMCVERLLETAMITLSVDDPKTGKQWTQSMGAFHHRMQYHAGKNIGYIMPHHEVLAKLKEDPVHNIQNIQLPMVAEPRPWTGIAEGGYYTTESNVVRQKHTDTSQRAYAHAAIQNGDLKDVLEGLDMLGKVPWQINAPVFEVMVQAWNSGEGIGGFVPAKTDIEPPPELAADATYQERAKWGKRMQEYENMKSGLHSQRCFQNLQLENARSFVNEKRFYFPHSIDFRGRAYPIPPYLNHIGADTSRGLLKFANGKELGTLGLQWLKVHLANLYGFDKASLRDREQFAMDNIEEISDSANNPLTGRKWWTKAEDPWQCLACCIELNNAMNSPDPTRFVSQLPVHQDGTCNGLQHYAALGGDHAGAQQVNLEPSDRPQDIYTAVAELVQNFVAKDAEKNHPYATFINNRITRKLVKRTVMTNVYGVTFIGAKEQVLGELRTIFPHFEPTKEIQALPSVALYIAMNIFKALGTIFNGAQEIQHWLGECGSRITTSISAEQIKRIKAHWEKSGFLPYDSQFRQPQNLHPAKFAKYAKELETMKTSIIWTTPLKMPVVQPYRKDDTKAVKTKLQSITVGGGSQMAAVDKRKQLQAFPPNFIHSLDATHMMLSARKCNEIGLDFAAVHDSFWTHACDIPTLNVVLRDAFVRMHSDDIVGRLAAEFAARYKGAMYKVPLHGHSKVALKIQEWRSAYRREATGEARATLLSKKSSEASYQEVALEARRLELLESEDPEERAQGEAMETPTSIWLANQDPAALQSYRVKILGEMSDKGSKQRQKEIQEKARDAELEVAKDHTDPAPKSSPMEAEAEAKAEEDDSPVRKSKGTAAHIHVWAPLTFPPLPKKGSWDVSRLRESQYFFS